MAGYTGGYPRAQNIQVVRGRYDFANDGGAAGTIAITTGTPIPDNAYIVGGFMEVDTAPVGSGASIGIRVEGSGDIVAVAAISGAPWSTTGLKDVVPDSTGSTVVKTTEARNISAVISAADLTAGAFDVVLFYTVIDD
jgi:hypothetical protein